MSDSERQESAAASSASEFAWRSAADQPSHSYLLPALLTALEGCDGPLLDLGCGNGALTSAIAEATGLRIVGVERSVSGLSFASQRGGAVDFLQGDIGVPLPASFPRDFRTAISAEVIEHLLLPRELFHRASESGATTLIVTTPYHGYLKNLALALTNKFDFHWGVANDYGHIKFFSLETLAELGRGCGWTATESRRIGRFPQLAKSMVMTFKRSS